MLQNSCQREQTRMRHSVHRGACTAAQPVAPMGEHASYSSCARVYTQVYAMAYNRQVYRRSGCR
jgi:hypothetical protein